MQEGRLNQREDDEHVHRDVVAQAGGADLVGDSHAPEDFHGARIASFHLRQELGRFLLLDQRAAHAAPAEIDGKRKADWAAADHQYLCFHRPYSALRSEEHTSELQSQSNLVCRLLLEKKKKKLI